MKTKEKVLKEYEKMFNDYTASDGGSLDELIKKVIDKTLAEVGKTHVTNKFMIEKLKEQRKVDKMEVGKVIGEVRNELGYVLCYGLDINLTKKQEKSFEKMFIELYEKKLKQKLGIK